MGLLVKVRCAPETPVEMAIEKKRIESFRENYRHIKWMIWNVVPQRRDKDDETLGKRQIWTPAIGRRKNKEVTDALVSGLDSFERNAELYDMRSW